MNNQNLSSLRQNRVFQEIAHAYTVLGKKRQEGLPFLSDWNGSHPYIDTFLGTLSEYPLTKLGDPCSYAFPQEDSDLQKDIARFHFESDGQSLHPAVLMIGGGATSLLSTLLRWVANRGFRRVAYVPPIHYTALALFEDLDLPLVRSSNGQAFEESFDLDLTNEFGTVLVISDPIWYAGKRVPENVISEIRSWQDRTGNFVIVDGTFQYQSWALDLELSSRLNPELTLRLICPTKALCMNGFRFSYLIIPRSEYENCASIHDVYHGTVSLSDHLFAKRAMELMRSRSHEPLLSLASNSFEQVINSDKVLDFLQPDSGYFAFIKTDIDLDHVAAMGPNHFGLDGYRNWIRVNLLSPVTHGFFRITNESIFGTV